MAPLVDSNRSKEVLKTIFRLRCPKRPHNLGKYLKLFFAALIIELFFIQKNAYAYINPGSGSYIFQILIAFLFGAAYMVKIFWTRIKTWFNNYISFKNKPDENRDDLK